MVVVWATGGGGKSSSHKPWCLHSCCQCHWQWSQSGPGQLKYSHDVCNTQCHWFTCTFHHIWVDRCPKFWSHSWQFVFEQKVLRSIYFPSILFLFHWWKLLQNLGIAASLLLDQVSPQFLAFTGWAVATYWHLENWHTSDWWVRRTSSLVPETKCSPRQMVCDTAPHLHGAHNAHFVEYNIIFSGGTRLGNIVLSLYWVVEDKVWPLLNTLGKGRQASGLELQIGSTDCTTAPLPQLPRLLSPPLQIPLIWFLTCQRWVWHSSQVQGRLACARGVPRRRGTLSGSRATAIGLSEATFWWWNRRWTSKF